MCKNYSNLLFPPNPPPPPSLRILILRTSLIILVMLAPVWFRPLSNPIRPLILRPPAPAVGPTPIHLKRPHFFTTLFTPPTPILLRPTRNLLMFTPRGRYLILRHRSNPRRRHLLHPITRIYKPPRIRKTLITQGLV